MTELTPKEADGEAPRDHALEQVSAIAARLLTGENYGEAADRALKLLDACQGKLDKRRRHAAILAEAREERKEWWDAFVPTVNGKTYHMRWRDVLKHVTGQSVESRAQPRFKKFYAFFWQECEAKRLSVTFDKAPAPPAAEIEARIARFKTEGLDSHRAGTLKAEYQAWVLMDGKARAQLRVLARKQKKTKASA